MAAAPPIQAVVRAIEVLQSLGLTWFASVMPPDKAVKAFLGDLKRAAGEISDRLEELKA